MMTLLWVILAARESIDIFLMHLYTNYVIRESQAKTSVHPIKKGRAKRGKAALESWGQNQTKAFESKVNALESWGHNQTLCGL